MPALANARVIDRSGNPALLEGQPQTIHLSPAYRERLAQRQRDKIASEVARGDEAAEESEACK